MERKGLVRCLVVVVMMFSCGSAKGAEGKGDFLGVGARFLYANAEDAFNSSMGGGTSVDEEFGYGGMVKLAVGRRLWLEFAADAFKFRGKLSEHDFRISTDLETIPLTGTVLVDLVSRENAIRPYVGAGIGYYVNNFEEVRESAFGFIADLRDYADFNADNGFGWHVCAGLDWFLTDHVAVNLEALYRWVDYDWDVVMKPLGLKELGEDLSGSGSDDLDGWVAIAGLSFFF